MEYMTRTAEELRSFELHVLERTEINMGFYDGIPSDDQDNGESNDYGNSEIEKAWCLPISIEPDVLLISMHIRHCSEWYHAEKHRVNNVSNEGKFTVTMPHTANNFPMPTWVLPDAIMKTITQSSRYANVKHTENGYEVVDSTVITLPTAIDAVSHLQLPVAVSSLLNNADTITQRNEQDENITVATTIAMDVGAAVTKQSGMGGNLTNMYQGAGAPHVDSWSLQQGMVDANNIGQIID